MPDPNNTGDPFPNVATTAELITSIYNLDAGDNSWPTLFTLNRGQTATVTASGSWLSHPHGDQGSCGPGGN